MSKARLATSHYFNWEDIRSIAPEMTFMNTSFNTLINRMNQNSIYLYRKQQSTWNRNNTMINLRYKCYFHGSRNHTQLNQDINK